MRKIHHDMLLRGTKLLNIGLLAVPLALCWRWSYLREAPHRDGGVETCLMVLLFAVLYGVFARIYEAFQVSTKRISEMIYSQGLAAVLSDGLVFIVLWLLLGHLPRIYPLLICLVAQVLLSTVWSYLLNRLYFRAFPPEPTAIIYGTRRGLDRLIGKYGLDKKYDVRRTISIDACLKDLSVLEGMRIVFISGVHSQERNRVLKYCVERRIHVLLAPRIGDVLLSNAEPTHLFHFPMLHVDWYEPTLEYLFVKRAADIVLSLLGLVVLSPVMLGIAIAVKACDGGPVIYSQVRMTKDGRHFRILKFRSMTVNAEEDGVARLSTGRDDCRVTPVGRVIRRLRLDELPQLVNILRGELSIVGPRPERPEIAAQYEREMPEFALRLQAKAGLTGYAQVYGKYNTTPYDKLQMDLMYIARPSLLADLKIMIATVKVLFMPESTDGVEEPVSASASAPARPEACRSEAGNCCQ